MSSEYRTSPMFKATKAYPLDRDMVFVAPDETEARRAFLYAQFNNLGHSVALDGNKFIIKDFFKQGDEKQNPV